MTPGARVAAAIEILDAIANGLATEQALTRWARNSRFAGSKDRAAVRDHVFDVARCRRIAAHLGQGETGRALMIGLMRHQQLHIEALFSGEGHAPSLLSVVEREATADTPSKAVVWNLPDWLIPEFEASLGEGAEAAAMALQQRAPITLRVNIARVTAVDAAALLLEDGVGTVTNSIAAAALTVVSGPRKLRNSRAYLEGLVELQDAASQALVECLPDAVRVLDFCAGGGGKALALAMRPGTKVFAYDVDSRRMSDLPTRAARAQAEVTLLSLSDLAGQEPFDVVLCDAPCSGSGAWRRAAEGKWLLTPDRLQELTEVQDSILDKAAQLTAPGGVLAYATCSVLAQENEARVAGFLTAHTGWACKIQQRFDICEQSDGFFAAHLTR